MVYWDDIEDYEDSNIVKKITYEVDRSALAKSAKEVSKTFDSVSKIKLDLDFKSKDFTDGFRKQIELAFQSVPLDATKAFKAFSDDIRKRAPELAKDTKTVNQLFEDSANTIQQYFTSVLETRDNLFDAGGHVLNGDHAGAMSAINAAFKQKFASGIEGATWNVTDALNSLPNGKVFGMRGGRTEQFGMYDPTVYGLQALALKKLKLVDSKFLGEFQTPQRLVGKELYKSYSEYFDGVKPKNGIAADDAPELFAALNERINYFKFGNRIQSLQFLSEYMMNHNDDNGIPFIESFMRASRGTTDGRMNINKVLQQVKEAMLIDPDLFKDTGAPNQSAKLSYAKLAAFDSGLLDGYDIFSTTVKEAGNKLTGIAPDAFRVLNDLISITESQGTTQVGNIDRDYVRSMAMADMIFGSRSKADRTTARFPSLSMLPRKFALMVKTLNGTIQQFTQNKVQSKTGFDASKQSIRKLNQDLETVEQAVDNMAIVDGEYSPNSDSYYTDPRTGVVRKFNDGDDKNEFIKKFNEAKRLRRALGSGEGLTERQTTIHNKENAIASSLFSDISYLSPFFFGEDPLYTDEKTGNQYYQTLGQGKYSGPAAVLNLIHQLQTLSGSSEINNNFLTVADVLKSINQKTPGSLENIISAVARYQNAIQSYNDVNASEYIVSNDEILEIARWLYPNDYKAATKGLELPVDKIRKGQYKTNKELNENGSQKFQFPVAFPKIFEPIVKNISDFIKLKQTPPKSMYEYSSKEGVVSESDEQQYASLHFPEFDPEFYGNYRKGRGFVSNPFAPFVLLRDRVKASVETKNANKKKEDTATSFSDILSSDASARIAGLKRIRRASHSQTHPIDYILGNKSIELPTDYLDLEQYNLTHEERLNDKQFANLYKAAEQDVDKIAIANKMLDFVGLQESKDYLPADTLNDLQKQYDNLKSRIATVFNDPEYNIADFVSDAVELRKTVMGNLDPNNSDQRKIINTLSHYAATEKEARKELTEEDITKAASRLVNGDSFLQARDLQRRKFDENRLLRDILHISPNGLPIKQKEVPVFRYAGTEYNPIDQKTSLIPNSFAYPNHILTQLSEGSDEGFATSKYLNSKEYLELNKSRYYTENPGFIVNPYYIEKLKNDLHFAKSGRLDKIEDDDKRQKKTEELFESLRELSQYDFSMDADGRYKISFKNGIAMPPPDGTLFDPDTLIQKYSAVGELTDTEYENYMKYQKGMQKALDDSGNKAKIIKPADKKYYSKMMLRKDMLGVIRPLDLLTADKFGVYTNTDKGLQDAFGNVIDENNLYYSSALGQYTGKYYNSESESFIDSPDKRIKGISTIAQLQLIASLQDYQRGGIFNPKKNKAALITMLNDYGDKRYGKESRLRAEFGNQLKFLTDNASVSQVEEFLISQLTNVKSSEKLTNVKSSENNNPDSVDAFYKNKYSSGISKIQQESFKNSDAYKTIQGYLKLNKEQQTDASYEQLLSVIETDFNGNKKITPVFGKNGLLSSLETSFVNDETVQPLLEKRKEYQKFLDANPDFFESPLSTTSIDGQDRYKKQFNRLTELSDLFFGTENIEDILQKQGIDSSIIEQVTALRNDFFSKHKDDVNVLKDGRVIFDKRNTAITQYLSPLEVLAKAVDDQISSKLFGTKNASNNSGGGDGKGPNFNALRARYFNGSVKGVTPVQQLIEHRDNIKDSKNAEDWETAIAGTVRAYQEAESALLAYDQNDDKAMEASLQEKALNALVKLDNEFQVGKLKTDKLYEDNGASMASNKTRKETIDSFVDDWFTKDKFGRTGQFKYRQELANRFKVKENQDAAKALFDGENGLAAAFAAVEKVVNDPNADEFSKLSAIDAFEAVRKEFVGKFADFEDSRKPSEEEFTYDSFKADLSRFAANFRGGKAGSFQGMKNKANQFSGKNRDTYLTAIKDLEPHYDQMMKDFDRLEQGQAVESLSEDMKVWLEAYSKFSNVTAELVSDQQQKRELVQEARLYGQLDERSATGRGINLMTFNNASKVRRAGSETLAMLGDKNLSLQEKQMALQQYSSAMQANQHRSNSLDQIVDSLGKDFKNAIFAGVGIAGITSALTKMVDNVKQLDKSVVDIQIATGMTRDSAKELITTYSDMGEQYGATTAEVAKGADSWLRQGYTLSETNDLIVDSLMLSKLGQIDSATATKNLTSMLKGFNLEAENATEVVDKLVTVDMAAATSAGDIATALSYTATSANLAGIGLDTIIGYVTTMQEVTQAGSSEIGNAMKSMLARMGQIKTGKLVDAETQEDISNVEIVLNDLGIKLRENGSDWRDFDDVLGDVAAQWGNYSDTQKRAVANAFGMTRQQEKFIVLMEHYGEAMEYANIAAGSSGNAQKKYQSYLGGMESKVNSLTASFEKLSTDLFDSDLFGTFTESATGFVGVLDKIVNSFGANTILGGLFGLSNKSLGMNLVSGLLGRGGFAGIRTKKELQDYYDGTKQFSDLSARGKKYAGQIQEGQISTLHSAQLEAGSYTVLSSLKNIGGTLVSAAIMALLGVGLTKGFEALNKSIHKNKVAYDSAEKSYNNAQQELDNMNQSLNDVNSQLAEYDEKAKTGMLSYEEIAKREELQQKKTNLESNINQQEVIAQREKNQASYYAAETLLTDRNFSLSHLKNPTATPLQLLQSSAESYANAQKEYNDFMAQEAPQIFDTTAYAVWKDEQTKLFNAVSDAKSEYDKTLQEVDELIPYVDKTIGRGNNVLNIYNNAKDVASQAFEGAFDATSNARYKSASQTFRDNPEITTTDANNQYVSLFLKNVAEHIFTKDTAQNTADYINSILVAWDSSNEQSNFSASENELIESIRKNYNDYIYDEDEDKFIDGIQSLLESYQNEYYNVRQRFTESELSKIDSISDNNKIGQYLTDKSDIDEAEEFVRGFLNEGYGSFGEFAYSKNVSGEFENWQNTISEAANKIGIDVAELYSDLYNERIFTQDAVDKYVSEKVDAKYIAAATASQISSKSTNDLLKTQKSIQETIASQKQNGFLSYNEIQTLVQQFKELGVSEEDVWHNISEVNGVLKINDAGMQDLIKTQAKEKLAQVELANAQARLELGMLNQVLATDKATDAEKERAKQLRNNIALYEQYEGQLRKMQGTYQAYVDAKNAGNEGDFFNSETKSAYDDVMSEFKAGHYKSNSFIAGLDYLFGQGSGNDISKGLLDGSIKSSAVKNALALRGKQWTDKKQTAKDLIADLQYANDNSNGAVKYNAETGEVTGDFDVLAQYMGFTAAKRKFGKNVNPLLYGMSRESMMSLFGEYSDVGVVKEYNYDEQDYVGLLDKSIKDRIDIFRGLQQADKADANAVALSEKWRENALSEAEIQYAKANSFINDDEYAAMINSIADKHYANVEITTSGDTSILSLLDQYNNKTYDMFVNIHENKVNDPSQPEIDYEDMKRDMADYYAQEQDYINHYNQLQQQKTALAVESRSRLLDEESAWQSKNILNEQRQYIKESLDTAYFGDAKSQSAQYWNDSLASSISEPAYRRANNLKALNDARRNGTRNGLDIDQAAKELFDMRTWSDIGERYQSAFQRFKNWFFGDGDNTQNPGNDWMDGIPSFDSPFYGGLPLSGNGNPALRKDYRKANNAYVAQMFGAFGMSDGIDLLNRPIIPQVAMHAAGWDTQDGYSTIYSNNYRSGNGTSISLTPISQDGTKIYTPTELDDYSNILLDLMGGSTDPQMLKDLDTLGLALGVFDNFSFADSFDKGLSEFQYQMFGDNGDEQNAYIEFDSNISEVIAQAQQTIRVGVEYYPTNSPADFVSGAQGGGVEAFGNAYASGSSNIDSSQTALVGELGQELVVDPHSGRWHTVGDNGAEFTRLPKDAIVFNHKQTEGILKNKHITTRGKALASGNAYSTATLVVDPSAPGVVPPPTGGGKDKKKEKYQWVSFENMYTEQTDKWFVRQEKNITRATKLIKKMNAEYKKGNLSEEDKQKLNQALTKANKELYEMQKKLWEEQNKRDRLVLEHLKNQTEQMKKLKEQHYEFLKTINDEREALRKEYETARDAMPFLTDAEKEAAFSAKDYTDMLETLSDIEQRATQLTEDYYAKINEVSQDDTYLLSLITEEYNNQLELIEKEYSVRKADLAVQKAQKNLENAKNNRNVAMLVGGKWTWTWDYDTVKKAMEDVIDAQTASTNAANDYTQQQQITEMNTYINKLDRQIEAINNMVYINDKLAYEIHKLTDELRNMLPQYASGGVNTTAGGAILHGTKSNPEVVFNSAAASKLYNFVANGPDLSTYMAESTMDQLKSNLITSLKNNVPTSTMAPVTDNRVYIDKIEVPEQYADQFLSLLRSMMALY